MFKTFKIIIYKSRKNIKEKLRLLFFRTVSSNNVFLIGFYYLFLDDSFHREMKSVYTGKKKYYKSLNKFKPNIFKLRRDIHKLEKGLIIRTGFRNFAIDNISEIVKNYVISYSSLDILNKKWTTSVLNNYFEKNDSIERDYLDSKKIFHEFIAENKLNYKSSKPFSYKKIKQTTFSYEKLFELAKSRYSVREFSEIRVSKKIVNNAIKIGLQAPTACNRQPFEILTFDKMDLISELVKLPMGVSTYSQYISNLAIVIGDLSAYFNERDRHLIYIDASLFAMSFLLGLESQGVSSCMINWPDISFREIKIHKLLNIPNEKRVIFFIAYGYAKKGVLVPFSEKKSVNEILKHNLNFK